MLRLHKNNFGKSKRQFVNANVCIKEQRFVGFNWIQLLIPILFQITCKQQHIYQNKPKKIIDGKKKTYKVSVNYDNDFNKLYCDDDNYLQTYELSSDCYFIKQ
jgi:hypothetical protein